MAFWTTKQRKKEEAIVKPWTSVRVPAVARFEAAKAFSPENGRVRIAFVGGDFLELFQNRIEVNLPASSLSVHLVEHPERGNATSILAELGERSRIPLAHFYEMLVQQPTCEQPGLLVTNGWANVCFVEGGDGIVVQACGDEGGWIVGSAPLEHPTALGAGQCRVISR